MVIQMHRLPLGRNRRVGVAVVTATTFHLVALGEHDKILLRRKFTLSQLLAYTANLPASLIGREAKAPSQAIATHRRIYRIEDT
jgi:hypothetical protein